MARRLFALVCLVVLAVAGCAEQNGEPAPLLSEDSSSLERLPLDEKVLRSLITDHESKFYNGTVPLVVALRPLGHAEWATSFDRKPNATWIEFQLHDKPIIAYGYSIFNGDSSDPIWSEDITDHPYQSVLIINNQSSDWRIVLKPHVVDKGYCWSVAVTQFYEEYPGKSFRALPEVENRPLPLECETG